MPEPKKRKTRHKTRIRRSKRAKPNITLINCPKCDTLIKPHHICRVCGTYKGIPYIDVEKRERRKKAKEKEGKEENE